MMLPFGQIQFDSLLTGVGQPKSGAGLSGQPDANGVTFESLMSLFGMGQPLPQVRANTQAVIDLEVISPDQLGETRQLPLQGHESELTTPQFLSAEVGPSIWPEPFAGEPGKPMRMIHRAAVAMAEPRLPFAIPAAQTWMVTMSHQQQVELKPGKYQVLKSQVTDGMLSLEVVPKDKLAEPIKITIPLDLLQNEAPTDAPRVVRPEAAIHAAARRIPLESTTSAMSALGSLIEKVNLRELQVTKDQTAPFAMTADESMAMRLIGEQVGQKVVLAAKLDRSQFRAVGTTKTSMPVAALDSKSGSTPISQPAFAGEAIFEPRVMPRSARQVAFAAHTDLANDDLAAVKTLLAIPSEKPAGTNQLESLLADSKATTQPLHESKPEPISVKITMPQELPSLKPDGKSVMLRIEPDHLGPAKLYLTMRHETLTAKVTVETIQAKAAVEASLDQLTDQLARAGVKVDHIDVGVRNGGADNQFFHRQAEWFRSARPNVARLLEEPLSEIIPQVIPSRPMYVGASGVNLFA